MPVGPAPLARGGAGSRVMRIRRDEGGPPTPETPPGKPLPSARGACKLRWQQRGQQRRQRGCRRIGGDEGGRGARSNRRLRPRCRHDEAGSRLRRLRQAGDLDLLLQSLEARQHFLIELVLAGQPLIVLGDLVAGLADPAVPGIDLRTRRLDVGGDRRLRGGGTGVGPGAVGQCEQRIQERQRAAQQPGQQQPLPRLRGQTVLWMRGVGIRCRDHGVAARSTNTWVLACGSSVACSMATPSTPSRSSQRASSASAASPRLVSR